jgi:hypothetical protein
MESQLIMNRAVIPTLIIISFLQQPASISRMNQEHLPLSSQLFVLQVREGK